MLNGEETSSKGFPWAVLIMSSRNDTTCAGALISDRLVLTSYWCADQDFPQYLTVGLGKGSFKKNIKLDRGSIRSSPRDGFSTPYR